jgi:hypothetical protein
MGIRIFDLRVWWESGKNAIGLAHGSTYYSIFYFGANSAQTFRDIITDLIDLLTKNPSEFIILNIHPEKNISGSQARKYIEEVKGYLENYYNFFYIKSSATPKLGEVRGKIITFSDAKGYRGELKGQDPWPTKYNGANWVTEGNFSARAEYKGLREEPITVVGERIKFVDSKYNDARNELFFSMGLSVPLGATSNPKTWWGHNPVNYAWKINPPLREFLINNRSLKFAGTFLLDFVTRELAFEITRVNPAIRQRLPESTEIMSVTSKYAMIIDSLTFAYSDGRMAKLGGNGGDKEQVLNLDKDERIVEIAYALEPSGLFPGCLVFAEFTIVNPKQGNAARKFALRGDVSNSEKEKNVTVLRAPAGKYIFSVNGTTSSGSLHKSNVYLAELSINEVKDLV